MRLNYRILVAVLVGMMSSTSFAQDQWSLEFRPGLNFPSEQIAGVEISTGFGFELTMAFNLFSNLSAYGGWGWNEFRTDEELGEAYLDLEETGFTLGLQLDQPLGFKRISYILRGGAVYNHFELEDIKGNVYADSGYGFGWQVETGMGFNISNTWKLRPVFRYRTLIRDIQVDNIKHQVDLNYFSVGIGLTKIFE